MAEQIILGTVTLPVDMQWFDEYSWSAIEQVQERALSGALIVESATRTTGRPITLVGRLDGTEGFALITRATVDALKALLTPAGQTYSLTLADDRVLNVAFRENDGPSIEATPMKHIAPHEPGDYYAATIRLMEV